MRGQDDRDALRPFSRKALPHRMPLLRIETGRRLVRADDLRSLMSAAGDRHAALHPARQRVDFASSRSVIWTVESFVALAARRVLNAKYRA